MNKFKIGDTVVRTDCSWKNCREGDRYTVCHVDSSGLVLTEVQGTYSAISFEVVIDYPNPPHKHAALIKAWADGATIQLWSDAKASGGKDGWMDCHNNYTSWLSDSYRVKPNKDIKIEELEAQLLEIHAELGKLKESSDGS